MACSSVLALPWPFSSKSKAAPPAWQLELPFFMPCRPSFPARHCCTRERCRRLALCAACCRPPPPTTTERRAAPRWACRASGAAWTQLCCLPRSRHGSPPSQRSRRRCIQRMRTAALQNAPPAPWMQQPALQAQTMKWQRRRRRSLSPLQRRRRHLRLPLLRTLACRHCRPRRRFLVLLQPRFRARRCPAWQPCWLRLHLPLPRHRRLRLPRRRCPPPQPPPRLHPSQPLRRQQQRRPLLPAAVRRLPRRRLQRRATARDLCRRLTLARAAAAEKRATERWPASEHPSRQPAGREARRSALPAAAGAAWCLGPV